MLLLVALLISVGCGGNNDITGAGDDGDADKPSESALYEKAFGSGRHTTDTDTSDRTATVVYANDGVSAYEVWLELVEVEINGEIKMRPVVVTGTPPASGDIFIELRLSEWIFEDDPEPDKYRDITVTIPRLASTSWIFSPDINPRMINMLSVMPIEKLIEKVEKKKKQGVTLRTAEGHDLTWDHKFLKYIPAKEGQHLRLPLN